MIGCDIFAEENPFIYSGQGGPYAWPATSQDKN
jgi:hypothetical protein